MGESSTSAIPYDSLKDFINPIRIFGHPVRSVTSPAALDTAQSNHITFCTLTGETALAAISRSGGGIVLCRDDLPSLEKKEILNCIFTVPNPRLSFMKCLQKFFAPERPVGIHPTAIIEEDVPVPDGVYIGPMAHLCSGVRLGEGAVIEDRVYIAPNTRIGKNVYIQVGAVIGCEGQGFERTATGEFEKFPQLGNVVIEDDVEIGANTTIIRGTLSATKIGRGSKIGHHVNIGHNAEIGRHVFISAGAIVCGSARVGDCCWLAPKCCIRNKVLVGRNVTVGLGSVVVADVPDGLTVVGVPSRVAKKYKIE